MNNYQLIQTAFRSLNNHKMRSLLTTLGIIIGMISIIAVMSIGEGAKYKVQKRIEGLGTNFIVILGGTPKRLTSRRMGRNLTLKQSDFKAIKTECDGVAMASPGLQRGFKVLFEGNNWQCMVSGVNEYFLEIRKWKLTKGYFFDKQTVKSGKKVAIIGQTIKKELFENRNPLGKTIRIKNIPFKIIGILEEKGKRPDGTDEDDLILIPLKTFQNKVAGIKSNRFGAIIVAAKNKDNMKETADDIRSVLRQQHNLAQTDKDDFTVFTQNDIKQASNAASKVLNLLLLIIASISLIVGGIGIMNIMLVTVTERTKEIGIRMAIGATTTAILKQFIFEAIIICLFGGIMGVIGGILVSNIVGHTLSWPVMVSLKSITIALSSSILIGLFFGFYPAQKASKLNVVEALIEQ